MLQCSNDGMTHDQVLKHSQGNQCQTLLEQL